VYGVIARQQRAALVAVEPRTGRTHQIRVHAAHAGAPLWGDATYGGPVRFTSARGVVQVIARIALHALWVEVPYDGTVFRVSAPVPDELVALWGALGGDPSDWEKAGAPLANLAGERGE
jgi:23S rRNA pseudouridine1911/1915/1917 synthase